MATQPTDTTDPDGVSEDEAQRISSVMQIINTEFAAVHVGGRIVLERLVGDRVRLRMLSDPTQIRPGGTISGPAMFKVADLAIWVGCLNSYGKLGVQAVTTNLAINFLRRPPAGDVICEAIMLKTGRRLAVGDVQLFVGDGTTLVAQATATYAIPSEA